MIKTEKDSVHLANIWLNAHYKPRRKNQGGNSSIDLILALSRELSQQIYREVKKFDKLDLRLTWKLNF
jgi:superfamily II DNA/RNA helicase